MSEQAAIVKEGEVYRSRWTGRRFLIFKSVPGFAECVGVHDQGPNIDLNTYGGWKTWRTLLTHYDRTEASS